MVGSCASVLILPEGSSQGCGLGEVGRVPDTREHPWGGGGCWHSADFCFIGVSHLPCTFPLTFALGRERVVREWDKGSPESFSSMRPQKHLPTSGLSASLQLLIQTCPALWFWLDR